MMFRLFVVVKVLIVLVILETNAARILCVFPTPSFSHQFVYRSLTKALADRGHDVMVITTHPFPAEEKPENLTEINVYNVSYQIWETEIPTVFHKTSDILSVATTFFKINSNIFEKQILSEPVKELIKNDKVGFDLLILESNVFATLGLLNVFDAPAIQTSTFGPMPGTYSMLGTSNQPFLYPTAICMQVYNHTFWEALNNLYNNIVYRYVIYRQELEDDKMLQRSLGPEILPISKLYEKVDLFLQTVYPIWFSNPPVPQGLVYLGGLHQKPPNDLPQKLQTFLDSSTNGVIYVSFGSNVHPSLLSQEKIDMMARVFSNLPYNILWKRDQNIQSKAAINIHTSTWFPQTDLLYHPKIKLFITQGGLQSTEEAITAGVPLLGIPVFGDQWMHTENYVHFRIGLQLKWNSVSEEELKRSIARVLEDKSYKENVVRLRSLMNDQPLSPSERVIWWTEYVIKHGGTRHLLPASANISWLEYFEVELIIIVVVFVIFVFSILTIILIKLTSYVFKRKQQVKHRKTI